MHSSTIHTRLGMVVAVIIITRVIIEINKWFILLSVALLP